MQDLAEDNVACRICMDNKDNCVSLFSQDLSKKIMEIAAVQVEKDDGLPDSICTECENDLEKCYEFRLKVQVADKKFRENIKFSQVDIAECNIKQERYHIDDGNFDNADENDSVSMDDEHYNEELDVEQQPRSTGEVEPDPLNHVVVVEEKERKIEMAEYTLGQDDVMSEEPQLKTVEEPAVDPLVCMKEETDAEVMDVDSNQPDPFGPSVSVRWTGTSQPLSLLLLKLSQGEISPSQTLHKGKDNQHVPSAPISAQHQSETVQQRNLNDSTKSLTGYDLSEKITPVPGINKFLPGQVKNIRNIPSIPTLNLQEGIANVPKQTRTKISKGKQHFRNERKVTVEKLLVYAPPSLDLEQVEAVAERENECFCQVCNVDCGNKDLLQEHKNRKDLICRTCTASFDNHDLLEAHFISHKKYTCEFCKSIFYARKDLHHHKNTVSPCNQKRARIQCRCCHRTFLHKRNLNQHMKLDHSANPADNFCLICNAGFKNSNIFTTHLKLVHCAYEDMECEICRKIMLGPTRLQYHIKTNHIETTKSCPICGKVIFTKSFRSHMETHDDKEAVCASCGVVLKNKNALRRHLKTHEKIQQNKTYLCTLCNETFNSLREKLKHKKQKHKKTPQPVFCDICGKQYKSLEVLKTHLVIHSDEKSFVCDVCGASFKTKAVLHTHNRIHTDVRKYSCTRCGQGFKWKQTFDKHVSKCEFAQGNN